LFIHAGLLAFLPVLFFVGMHLKVILEYKQLFGALFPSSALPHGTLQSRFSKRPTSALLKCTAVSLLCTLLSILRILNFTISWSLLLLTFTFFFLVRMRTSIVPVFIDSYITWRRKLSSTHSKNLLISYALLFCPSNTSADHSGQPLPLPNGSAEPGAPPLVCSDSTCHQPEPPDPFLWGCSPASCTPVCRYMQSCPIPGAEYGLYSGRFLLFPVKSGTDCTPAAQQQHRVACTCHAPQSEAANSLCTHYSGCTATEFCSDHATCRFPFKSCCSCLLQLYPIPCALGVRLMSSLLWLRRNIEENTP